MCIFVEYLGILEHITFFFVSEAQQTKGRKISPFSSEFYFTFVSKNLHLNLEWNSAFA